MNNEFAVNDRRYVARTLYTRCGNTIREIAQDLKVDEATIRKWVWEGEWDLVRTSLSISKETQIKKLYEVVGQLNERMTSDQATIKDVDLLMKYTAAIKNLDTDNSVYAIIEAAELFLTWLYRRNMKLSQTFTRHFDIFIKERKAA